MLEKFIHLIVNLVITFQIGETLNSVSAQKLGGGAILEMSHELDYIHWIFGNKYMSKIFYLNTKNLKIDVEDNVKIIFNFKIKF